MEQLKNEQTEVDSHPAVAENQTGDVNTEVSLGKFKDSQSLLSAYNALEAEFTKRCQKIKELEEAISKSDKDTPPIENWKAKDKPTENEFNQEDVLKDYIRSVLSKKQAAVVLDGGGVCVKTPAARPKSLREASVLAQELFSK